AVPPRAGGLGAGGGAALDGTPAAVKDWAIRNFGTDDKLVLQAGILTVLALFALCLGTAALRFRRAGAAGVLLFGIVGALAATTRPDSIGPPDALPSLVGAATGAVVLYVLVGRLAVRREPVDGAPDHGWDRRGFVIAASAAAVASAGAGSLGRVLNGFGARDAVASRERIVLPAPRTPPPPPPGGGGLGV
ncbi:molybdopterin-binding oxidoreductase, partial [Streptomyces sp. NPDC058953]